MSDNPWRTPVKVHGVSLTTTHFKYDPAWLQAIREVTSAEDSKYTEKVGVSTIIQDLSSRNGTYFVDLRKKVSKRYKQIKRERAHGTVG